MTTPRKNHRFWHAILAILAIASMMFVGSLVTILAILTAPENFSGAGSDEISDLGAVRFIIGYLLLLLLPWYRKIPLALIITGGFHAVILQGDPYVLAIGLTVWIVRAHQRWHWIVSGIGLAAIVVNIAWHLLALWRWETDFDTTVAALVVLSFGFATLGLVLAIGFTTRHRRRMRQARDTVEAVEHDREVLSSEMTRQTEREYLAREVHDTLAQRLTALSLQAGQMQKSLADTHDADLTSALQDTKRYSDQALKDLRTLVTSLRAHGEKEPTVPSVAPGGFQDLKALLDDAVHQGLIIQPQIMLNNYDAAPDALQRAVLRITQEALTNALRHSTDNRVNLRMEGQPGEGLMLEFTNARDAQQHFAGGTGTGLLGIRERAELLGGSAQEEYLPEHFRLTIHLPWTLESVEAL